MKYTKLMEKYNLGQRDEFEVVTEKDVLEAHVELMEAIAVYSKAISAVSDYKKVGTIQILAEAMDDDSISSNILEVKMDKLHNNSDITLLEVDLAKAVDTVIIKFSNMMSGVFTSVDKQLNKLETEIAELYKKAQTYGVGEGKHAKPITIPGELGLGVFILYATGQAAIKTKLPVKIANIGWHPTFNKLDLTDHLPLHKEMLRVLLTSKPDDIDSDIKRVIDLSKTKSASVPYPDILYMLKEIRTFTGVCIKNNGQVVRNLNRYVTSNDPIDWVPTERGAKDIYDEIDVIRTIVKYIPTLIASDLKALGKVSIPEISKK